MKLQEGGGGATDHGHQCHNHQWEESQDKWDKNEVDMLSDITWCWLFIFSKAKRIATLYVIEMLIDVSCFQ